MNLKNSLKVPGYEIVHQSSNTNLPLHKTSAAVFCVLYLLVVSLNEIFGKIRQMSSIEIRK